MAEAAEQNLARFREQDIVFANGARGRNIEIPSASPINYHQAISHPSEMPKITVDGKLFVPPTAEGRSPLVIIVPGSLGVAPSHLAHAEALTDRGFAAFVIDSFGARGVTSTVANQTQFSFAASAYDVLAALKVLLTLPDIDGSRVGAQGHSRGGSAVLTAATRRFADAVVGTCIGFNGVLAAYPWCGHQFLDPQVGETDVRIIMGDADEWCSPMQVQGYRQAVRLTRGKVVMRLLGGTHHSFDRGTAIVRVEDASVSPAAPTVYLADDGAFIHPLEDQPDTRLTDRDLMIYALKAGYGRKGARIGSRDGESALFTADMLAFWSRILKDS